MTPQDTPVEILVDERVEAIDRGTRPPPDNWVSRALYPGEAGARRWMAVVQEPTYPLRNLDRLGLRQNRLAAIEGLRVATLVSLGPGDGSADVELVTALQAASGRSVETGGPGELRYIPVDISRSLLEAAAANVRPFAPVVVGIHGDFEGGQDFLAEVLDRHASPPVLHSLLGGTLGNLDGGEGPFFEGYRRLMKAGDSFLIDVPLAGLGWQPADEPRLKPDAYSAAFRHFLAWGQARLRRPGDTETPALDDRSFGERVAFSLGRDSATGAEVITVSDRPSGHSLLTFRRYRWEPILRWFEDRSFRIAFARSSLSSPQDRFGMGVVRLTVP